MTGVASCLAVGRASAEEYEVRQAETPIAGELASAKVRIGAPADCPNPHAWIWGSDRECPRRIVADLVVRWASGPIFVPVSAYSDLAGPHAFEMRRTDSGFELLIRGGDAASAYSAILEFEVDTATRAARLHRRAVRSVGKTWEETVYQFEPFGDDEPPIPPK